MSQTELYQSVLKKLGGIPVEYLSQVDAFLSKLSQESQDQLSNREKILALAGSWKDMSEEDFQEYREHAKGSGDASFNREVDI